MTDGRWKKKSKKSKIKYENWITDVNNQGAAREDARPPVPMFLGELLEMEGERPREPPHRMCQCQHETLYQIRKFRILFLKPFGQAVFFHFRNPFRRA